MKIRLKAPAGLESTGIYGKDAEEIPVGHEMEVAEEPKGWAGRYDIIDADDTKDKIPLLNEGSDNAELVKQLAAVTGERDRLKELVDAHEADSNKQYSVGEETKSRVFAAAGLTNLSDLQAVLDAVEQALKATPTADPLDHDDDGKKGGSKATEASPELTKARADYQEVVGKKAFNGWSVEELQAKIDAKLAE